MKKCMQCGKYNVKNPDHDYCYNCFKKVEDKDETSTAEDKFEKNLDKGVVFTTYIMFYGSEDTKIGHTNDLSSRIIEIKRKYPKNKLVYFREFSTESESRRFEAWLKGLTERELNKFVSSFQDKIRKVESL